MCARPLPTNHCLCQWSGVNPYTYREKVAARFLKAEHLCFSAFLLLRPPSVFLLFSQFLLESLADVQLCERKQAAGLRLWLAWRDTPEKQRPLNCTNTTAERLQQGPPMEVASEQPRTKLASWISMLPDKEHDMHGRIKSQRQMCHKKMLHKR